MWEGALMRSLATANHDTTIIVGRSLVGALGPTRTEGTASASSREFGGGKGLPLGGDNLVLEKPRSKGHER